MRHDAAVVLLVSSKISMRKVIQSHLFRRNFGEILEADDGREALLILQKKPVNCIIADWDMPNMDGIDLLLQLRADPEHQEVLFMMVTGESDRDRIEKAILAGVDDLLINPFTPATLCEKVFRLIRKSSHIPKNITIDLPKDQLNNESGPYALTSLTDCTEPAEQETLIQNLSNENSRLKADLERICSVNLTSPLTEILEQTETFLEHRSLSAEQRLQINNLRDISYELQAKLDCSLNLWKMETDQYVINASKVDIVSIAQKVIETERPKAKQKSITVAFEAPHNAYCQGEALLCLTMLGNLIRYAIHVSPKKETVLISIEKNSTVTISIHHEGLVPLSQQETFFQKESVKKDSSNNETDLYAAYVMAKTQGGEIALNSKVNEGSTLTIQLPHFSK